MMRVALVTCSKLPQLSEDDRLLLPELGKKRMSGLPVVWDDPLVAWNSFDAVVVRSCWDYFIKYEAFSDWLKSLQAINVPVFNSPAIMLWNSSKKYLLEFEKKGIPIVPTTWIMKGEKFSVASLEKSVSWTELVVKPVISADAFLTYRLLKSEMAAFEARLESIAKKTGLMIQPFVKEVLSRGEWSLIYLEGEFSHAVLK
jgi:glutathione synthase/RimK-type ligase-like ATP-grasp enzyme